MLDLSDLQAIRELMKEELKESNKLIEKRVEENEKMLLDEIVFNRNAVEKMVEKVQKNIEELNQYYRITKLENETTSVILRLYQKLENEMEELKKRIA